MDENNFFHQYLTYLPSNNITNASVTNNSQLQSNDKYPISSIVSCSTTSLASFQQLPVGNFTDISQLRFCNSIEIQRIPPSNLVKSNANSQMNDQYSYLPLSAIKFPTCSESHEWEASNSSNAGVALLTRSGISNQSFPEAVGIGAKSNCSVNVLSTDHSILKPPSIVSASSRNVMLKKANCRTTLKDVCARLIQMYGSVASTSSDSTILNSKDTPRNIGILQAATELECSVNRVYEVLSVLEYLSLISKSYGNFRWEGTRHLLQTLKIIQVMLNCYLKSNIHLYLLFIDWRIKEIYSSPCDYITFVKIQLCFNYI